MKIHRTILLQAFLSPQLANVTKCSNQSAVYSEWKHFCLKLKKKLLLIALRKKVISMKKDLIDLDITIKEYYESTGKCNSMVELFTSTGRDLDNSTITFSVSTGKEYCEWAAKHFKIICLPRGSTLNRSWPWWIFPQVTDNTWPRLTRPWLRLLHEIDRYFHVHSIDCACLRIHKHPDIKNATARQ